MKRNTGSKVIGLILAVAIVLTSFTDTSAATADSNIILENQTYSGGLEYIKTFMAADYAGKRSIKLTYEYESLDSDGKYLQKNDDGTEETKDVNYSDTFEFVAFDMSWGGWVSTGVGQAEPKVGIQYTSTISIKDIEDSLDGVDCMGFNFATGKIGDSTVKLIKMEYVDAEQVAAGAEFTGSWEKGKGGSFTRMEGDARITTNEWCIGISNLYVRGFKNPTIAVTVDYETAPNEFVQAEIQNGETGAAIFGNYPYVDKAGTVTYTTQFSDDLTSLNVCYDKCVVKKICIYNDIEGDVPADTDVSRKTAAQVAKDMGLAWNLGNALEAVNEQGNVDEIAWGNARATKDLIRAVKAQGFQTIRIPVSYLDKIDSDNKVDDAYLARVNQVVDCAYDLGMYVVVDMHNDGGHGIPTKWLDITKKGADFEAVKAKFAAVWRDIAIYFKDYDQRLVFEGYNELMNGNYGVAASTTELANVNALAQTFVTTVRSAGGTHGKNADRILIVAGYNTNIDETVKGFVKPNDPSANRLMLSIHYYDPYMFTLDTYGTTIWEKDEEIAHMINQFDMISQFASDKGMPVFLGGYGAIDKNNTEQRVKYCNWLNYVAGYQGNIVTVYWDNGVTKQNGSGLFDRVTNTVTKTGSIIISGIKHGRADGIAAQD